MNRVCGVGLCMYVRVCVCVNVCVRGVCVVFVCVFRAMDMVLVPNTVSIVNHPRRLRDHAMACNPLKLKQPTFFVVYASKGQFGSVIQ